MIQHVVISTHLLQIPIELMDCPTFSQPLPVYTPLLELLLSLN